MQHHAGDVSVVNEDNIQPELQSTGQHLHLEEEEHSLNMGSLFDPVHTRYGSKAAMVEACNEQAAAQNFRLWLGEGRPVKEMTAGSRVELACYRFRNKVNGRRTRVGGCKFVIKAAQLPWQGDSDVERQWEIVGGHYVHNHECNSLKPPRRPNGEKDPSNPPKEPKERLKKKARSYSPNQMSSQSPELLYHPEAGPSYLSEASPSYHLSDSGNSLAPFDSPHWPALLPNFPKILSAMADDISVLARESESTLDDNLRDDPVASTSMGTFAMDPSLESAHINTPLTPESSEAERLLLQQISAALPILPTSPFHLQSDGFGTVSVSEFFREQNPDLEQYADAFRNAGCTDLGSLLRLPENDMKGFIDEDLPKICPELTLRPFHRRLLLTVISEYRTIKQIAEDATAVPGLEAALQSNGMGHDDGENGYDDQDLEQDMEEEVELELEDGDDQLEQELDLEVDVEEEEQVEYEQREDFEEEEEYIDDEKQGSESGRGAKRTLEDLSDD